MRGETNLALYGRTVVAEDSFTRPADTTQYAAGDVINNATAAPTAQTISVARMNGGGGVILSALLIDSASEATKADLEVWLFDTAVTAMEDNAAFDPTDAEMLNLVGVIDLGSSPPVGLASGNCVYTVDSPGLAFQCASTVQTLWWVLVVRNTYTPISGEAFTLRLGVLQD